MISKFVLFVYNLFYDYINTVRKKNLFLTSECTIKIGKDFKFDFLKNKISISPKSTLIIGDNVQFRDYCNIWIDANSSLILGKNVFFNNYCSINTLGSISIGDYTIFGEGVRLFDHNHVYTDNDTMLQFSGCKIGKIEIGKNCWIGANVVILKDVKIGDNVVVGAGNLIYKDVPSNVIIKKKSEYIIENKV